MMKYRVNYLNIVKDNMRSASLILEAKTPEEATNKANALLEQKLGNDNYRITTAKPW